MRRRWVILFLAFFLMLAEGCAKSEAEQEPVAAAAGEEKSGQDIGFMGEAVAAEYDTGQETLKAESGAGQEASKAESDAGQEAPKTAAETEQGTPKAESNIVQEPVEVLENVADSLTEEEKLLNDRMEYYRKSAYYEEMMNYWENVREVRDVAYRMVPLYESDKQYLTKETLAADPPVVIHVAKNEIYARHGYIFKNPDLYNYFMGCIWYTPTTAPEDFSDEVFNDYEKENLKLLQELDTL